VYGPLIPGFEIPHLEGGSLPARGSLGGKQKGGRSPPSQLWTLNSKLSGGAGNRTLVRTSIQRSAYVRRPMSLRGPGPVIGQPSRNEPPKISPPEPEEDGQPARLCYSTLSPRAGSIAEGACSEREAQLVTQPAPSQSWQLNVSKRFNQEPGPGHAATPSTDPSKPVAPSIETISKVIAGPSRHKTIELINCGVDVYESTYNVTSPISM